jgi:hypothetical protein
VREGARDGEGSARCVLTPGFVGGVLAVARFPHQRVLVSLVVRDAETRVVPQQGPRFEVWDVETSPGEKVPQNVTPATVTVTLVTRGGVLQ